MQLPSRVPGIVHSYDGPSREVRVEIVGLSDGGDQFPLAQIEYPIGDKSASDGHPTEIEILAGDPVWLAFEGGDERFPIITGYRNPTSGNSIDWRRWHHANIEMNADGELLLTAGVRVHIVAPDVLVECDTAEVNVTGDAIATVGGSATVSSSGEMQVHSDAAVTIEGSTINLKGS